MEPVMDKSSPFHTQPTSLGKILFNIIPFHL
jgi:hypothetical protein